MYYCQEIWDKFDIKSESEKLFYSVMKELVSKKSVVSRQYKYSNLLTILDEIIENCNQLEHSSRGMTYIKTLLDEAKLITKQNELQKLFSMVNDHIQEMHEILKDVDEKEGSVYIKKIRKMSKRAHLLKGLMIDYFNKIKNNIESMVVVSKIKEKKYFINLCGQYVTYLIANGYSVNSVSDAISVLEDKNLPFDKRIKSLFQHFDFKDRKFECFYFSRLSLPELKTNEITISKQFQNDNGSLTQIYEESNCQTVIKIIVSALNFNEAKVSANEIKNSIYGIRKFYEPVSATKEYNQICVLNNNELHTLNDSDIWQDYLFNSKKPEFNIRNFIDFSSTIVAHDRNKIIASLQYHNIAMENQNEVTRFVNMWVALESLVEIDDKKTIIDQICSYVSSSNATRYVFNRCLAFSKDLGKIYSPKRFAPMKNDQVLEKLLLPEEQIGSEILSKLDANPLLRLQISETIENIFSDRNKLKNRCDEHKQNIDWQLRRIYKVRNYIVHDGGGYRRLNQLTFHLHKYYVQTMHNLIYDMKRYKGWTAQMALNHRVKLYDDFIKTLKNTQKKMSKECLLSPELIYEASTTESVWTTDDKVE